MTAPRILVTAAAGNTGYPTALQLLERGHQVRALVRRPGPRSEQLRARGAEVVVGSLDDPAAVGRALAGVRRTYLCPPLLPGLLEKAALFAAAAEEARLEHLVVLSQWLADPAHPSLHTRQSWLAETVLVRMQGVGTTIVDPGWFADNYMAALEPIAQFGLLPLPLGEGRNAPPSNEDIARVVAAILSDPEPHLGKRYRPTGPELLSPQQIAAAFARLLGRSVRYVDMPAQPFAKVAKSLGFHDYTTAQVLHYFAEYTRDAFAVGAPTDVVHEIGGRPAESFETIARRYVEASSYARRSIGSRLRAGARLAAAMLRPAPDLDVVARSGDYALATTLATDSGRWRETHDPDAGTAGPGRQSRPAPLATVQAAAR